MLEWATGSRDRGLTIEATANLALGTSGDLIASETSGRMPGKGSTHVNAGPKTGWDAGCPAIVGAARVPEILGAMMAALIALGGAMAA